MRKTMNCEAAGRTLIEILKRYGSEDEARQFIRPDILKAQCVQRRSVLHLAVQNDKFRLIPLLIECGADVDATDGHERYTLLHNAARYGGLAVWVKTLVEEHNASVNIVDSKGRTPLHRAVERNNGRFVSYIIDHQADTTILDASGSTALHLSIERCSDQDPGECAEILIRHSVSNNTKDAMGNTPLHLAALKNLHKLIALLLEHQADATIGDSKGLTALHIAVEAGQLESTIVLIDRCPSIDMHSKTAATALHTAVLNNKREFAHLLIDRGANINSRDENGFTPLHMAAQHSLAGLITFLIQRKADMTIRDDNGNTALHLSTQLGDYASASALFERGADVGAYNHAGFTPQMLLSQRLNESEQWLPLLRSLQDRAMLADLKVRIDALELRMVESLAEQKQHRADLRLGFDKLTQTLLRGQDLMERYARTGCSREGLDRPEACYAQWSAEVVKADACTADSVYGADCEKEAIPSAELHEN